MTKERLTEIIQEEIGSIGFMINDPIYFATRIASVVQSALWTEWTEGQNKREGLGINPNFFGVPTHEVRVAGMSEEERDLLLLVAQLAGLACFPNSFTIDDHVRLNVSGRHNLDILIEKVDKNSESYSYPKDKT